MSAEPKKPLKETAFELAQGVFLWLDDRLHISHLWEHTAGHPIPKCAASWFYVFGSATLLCLILQIITGSLWPSFTFHRLPRRMTASFI
jgi:hypothetical protein